MKTPLIEQFEKEGHPYYSSARWVSISNWEKHVSAAINIVNTFLDSFSLNSNISQVVIMSVFLTWNNVLLPKREIYETLCVIWYHLYNLNVTLFHGCILHFSKLHKWCQVVQNISYDQSYPWNNGQTQTKTVDKILVSLLLFFLNRII